MAKVTVTVLQNHFADRMRKVGETYETSAHHASELKGRGLVACDDVIAIPPQDGVKLLVTDKVKAEPVNTPDVPEKAKMDDDITDDDIDAILGRTKPEPEKPQVPPPSKQQYNNNGTKQRPRR